ncbi:Pyridine nucleotide-disulfide oxidoreductase class-II, partial [Penicillium expansum]
SSNNAESEAGRKALLSISHAKQPNSETIDEDPVFGRSGWKESGISQDIEINAKADFLEPEGISLSQIKAAQIVSRKLCSKLPLKTIYLEHRIISAE